MEVKDKLALVTGGARRVGRAVVEALAARGARPLIHCHRSQAEANALARATGGIVLQADLSQPAGARSLVEEVLALEGELALWVNNAAAFERRPFLESDDQIWQETLQLTLLSPQRCIRGVAPRMIDGGVIINILDVAAHQPWRGYAHHCVAKAALLMLTRALAVELAPRLRVCAVTPGVVLPPDTLSAASRDRLIQGIPLERQGDPADVARAVLYLASADYCTGVELPVDGGMTVRSIF